MLSPTNECLKADLTFISSLVLFHGFDMYINNILRHACEYSANHAERDEAALIYQNIPQNKKMLIMAICSFKFITKEMKNLIT